MRKGGDFKYVYLNMDLYVFIEVFGSLCEVYVFMVYVMEEVKKFLVLVRKFIFYVFWVREIWDFVLLLR